jgi:hypothetical protein
MEWEDKQETEKDRICNGMGIQTADRKGKNLLWNGNRNSRQKRTEFVMEWKYKQQTEKDRICNGMGIQTADRKGQNL